MSEEEIGQRAIEHLAKFRVVVAASKTVRNATESNHNLRLWAEQADAIVKHHNEALEPR